MKEKLLQFWSDHDHELLVGFGTAGWFTTTIWSVAVTPKALNAIEKKKEELGVDKLTPLQMIEACGLYYSGPAILGALATLSIFSGVKKANRKQAVLAAGYSFTENLVREYKDKVVEVIGEEKEKKIEEEIKEAHKDEPEIKEQATYIFGDGDVRAFDNITKQWLTLESVEDYRSVINDINMDLITTNYVTVDDYCDALKIPYIDDGANLEWHCYSKNELLQPKLGHNIDKRGRPYLIVGVDRPPRRN